MPRNAPTGFRKPVDALTWKWNDDKKNETVGEEHPNHIKNRGRALLKNDDTGSGSETVIKIMENGPCIITGGFILERNNGSRSKFSGTLSLCRCGKSKLKPFCDGSHR